MHLHLSGSRIWTISFPRISLARALAFVALVAAGLAALLNASSAWSGLVLVLTLGLLASAVLGVACRHGAKRAWWLGFALFGWGFAALSVPPWPEPQAVPLTRLLDLLYVRVSPTKAIAVETYGLPPDGRLGDSLVVSNNVPPDLIPVTAGPADTAFLVGTLDVTAFRTIGRCLLTLVVGCVGGAVARWFHASREPASGAIHLARRRTGSAGS